MELYANISQLHVQNSDTRSSQYYFDEPENTHISLTEKANHEHQQTVYSGSSDILLAPMGPSQAASAEHLENRNLGQVPNSYPIYHHLLLPDHSQNYHQSFPQSPYPSHQLISYPGYPMVSYPIYPHVTIVSMPGCQPYVDNPPRDYLACSILNTIFCCLKIGIYAIIKSANVRTAVSVGNRVQAEKESNRARTANIVSFCLGLIAWIVVIIIFLIQARY